MKKFFLRLFSSRITMLEEIVKYKDIELKDLRSKNEMGNLLYNGKDRELKSYKRLTYNLSQDIITQKNALRYQRQKLEDYGDGTMKKRITNEFRKFLVDSYGLHLRDGKLFFLNEENEIECEMPKRK